MPPKTRIPRERVEEAAFEIAREKGMSAITATGVAERLRCSTQPVYWWFGTMDSLKAAVRRRAGERYKSFLFQPVENVPRYKAAGINYIRFAKEERELFRILFMSETKAVPILESTLDENKEELLGIIRMQTGWTTYVRIGCIQPCGSSPTESRSCSQPAPRHFRKGRSGKC